MEHPAAKFIYDVFLAYPRAVRKEARELRNLLIGQGFKVFLDEDLSPGARWDEELREAILASRALVVILPEERSDSSYLASEIQLGIAQARTDGRRKVVPICLSDAEPRQEDLPYGLGIFQAIYSSDVGDLTGVSERLEASLRNSQETSLHAAALDGVSLFASRHAATSEMLKDIGQATSAYFLGISQSKLARYLEHATTITDQRTLPLERVEVYFANDEVGEMLEPNRFRTNVAEAMLSIASTLTTNPRFSSPEVFFYQLPHVIPPNGSRFLLRTDRVPPSLPFSVAYNVFVERDIDLSTAWTMVIRYSQCNAAGKDVFRREVASFERLKAGRRISLFEVRPHNPWDRSAAAWRDFETKYAVYPALASRLWAFGGIESTHQILDVGSGCGAAYMNLIENLDGGSLTLVDNSPGMLAHAKRLYHSHKQVRVLLGDATRPLMTDQPHQLYDRILSFLSLQAFSSGAGSIHNFALNCRRLLAPGGRVALSVHNSVIHCETPEGFESWSDPLRAAMLEELSRLGIPIRAEGFNVRRLNVSEVEREFYEAGLVVDKDEVSTIERTMQDRLAMWRTPAILDSLVDVRQLGEERHEELITKVGNQVRGLRTMPTTVHMFSFKHATTISLTRPDSSGRKR